MSSEAGLECFINLVSVEILLELNCGYMFWYFGGNGRFIMGLKLLGLSGSRLSFLRIGAISLCSPWSLVPKEICETYFFPLF